MTGSTGTSAAPPRRIALSQLLKEVYDRYRVPMLIGETSHVGHGRGKWITELADEVRKAQQMGVPLEGICLYPIVDRTDWENDHNWHNSGLWDVEADELGILRRVLCQPYYEDYLKAQPYCSPGTGVQYFQRVRLSHFHLAWLHWQQFCTSTHRRFGRLIVLF